ncbi:MAG: hypothetical protein P4L93_06640, partial [Coriobacteriia bacterium]|nr:hypothetical protein [Coriobacteriia bacterium]
MTRQPDGFPPPAADSSRADAEGVARALVAELERDLSLDQPAQISRRVDAAERLEAYLLDAQRCTDGANDQKAEALRQRARAIQSRLQAADSRLFDSIRSEVRQGPGGVRLAEWCATDSDSATTPVPPRGHAYDHLDVLVAGVLRFDTPAEAPGLPPEMVRYQPTPARHIFDLLSRVSLTRHDVLVDLGSGLGHVPLLAAICTSARSVGVELQKAYVDVARRSASALGLVAVTFEQQDARLADLSAGTVFYLYTPFTGAILRSV